MLERIFRVLVGFIMACLAAGFTKVLFAVPPSELLNLPPDVQADRLGLVVESGLFASIWSLIFSFPFALVAAAIGEWRRIRSWTYYAIIGLAVAMIGFLTQHSAEQAGQPSIMNNYGLTAFITSGFMAGLVYWLFSGRSAGGAGQQAVHMTSRSDERPSPRPTATAGSTPAKPKTGSSVPASGSTKKA
ncbi:MAG: hypothetical protein ACKVP7_02125 [Hyphomicrobiaceae bacterium]